ncbi:unnamed protein product [Vitrella brassicaformis CCMP3155]|uniref:Thioredoxin domain-containing protein n=1 Tax=Vitrella brassicaformis (strain CCMP3155) TaxID=1169540 RepID=A0A0G4ENR7_VITBC|nr:unnamed protein product [Vitrella brassicaformis CCMP3155]|eukprot:CEL98805.1 unnamed protein product [Vitrella brassicaformis CCMP3155]
MLFVCPLYLALLPSLLPHLIILIALLPPSSSAFVVPLGRVAVSSSSSHNPRHTALRAESEQAVDFDEAVELVNGQGTPLLVDFFARWCGPCQMMSPVLESVARDLKGKLVVAKVDTDLNADIANRYGIQGLPTLILFMENKPVHRIEGYMEPQDLMRELEPFLTSDEDDSEGGDDEGSSTQMVGS